MKGLLLFILIFSTDITYAKVISICDQFPEYCSNVRRNQSRPTNSSLPTQSSAVFTNPAAVSTDKGFGIETINYNGDSQIGIVTGTGRVGAAISNNPSEETFFGNGVQEDFISYRSRWFNKEKYESDKLVLSGAMNVFGKKKKKGLQMDVGASYRQINDTDTTYIGGGVALNWSRILSFSYAEFRDAYVKDYRGKTEPLCTNTGYCTDTFFANVDTNLFQKTFQVRNYVAGFNYNNWSFDYSWFTTTDLDDNTKAYVKIFNVSYFYRHWMFTVGTRQEESPRETFDYDQEKMVYEKFKYDGFLGVQYALGNHFVLGLFNNYYLLDEWTLGVTFFF